MTVAEIKKRLENVITANVLSQTKQEYLERLYTQISVEEGLTKGRLSQRKAIEKYWKSVTKECKGSPMLLGRLDYNGRTAFSDGSSFVVTQLAFPEINPPEVKAFQISQLASYPSGNYLKIAVTQETYLEIAANANVFHQTLVCKHGWVRVAKSIFDAKRFLRCFDAVRPNVICIADNERSMVYLHNEETGDFAAVLPLNITDQSNIDVYLVGDITL